ncbi:hypothetical protein [Modestobacter versicolor]|uniref:Uncharacterized protein n=1 Tax=Modestobacter versicolor TaxID=429133 RepID=A0A323VEM5_9ACTN|nr:hypothetical protein [Modestobacter versicolor]MBB3674352.1 hypothetical protein [Modestobacter versicolor]PZA23105.1 hypothetical protein DMO24_01685 [Modestobacter versicolor]
MSYDALVESVRLLEGAPPAGAARLSRRVRHLPLAVDRDGDVAATMFLRRGVSGVPELDVHTLELVDGVWSTLGGGGGPGDGATRGRPRLVDLGSPAVSSSGGGTARTSGSWLRRRRSGWIWWAELRVAEEVTALRVDARFLPVAAHGCAVVVWTRQPPQVTGLDASGSAVGPVLIRPAGSRHPGSIG